MFMSQGDESLHYLLPLAPAAFAILLSLAGGERHGYGIMQEVAASTKGGMRLGPGTLYRTIKQLLAAGWIEEADERTDPALNEERRRYYRLTALGRRVAQAEALRLARLVHQAQERKLLGSIGEVGEAQPGLEGML
jgi:DNA-binding PadR family transcriptional regulator